MFKANPFSIFLRKEPFIKVILTITNCRMDLELLFSKMTLTTKENFAMVRLMMMKLLLSFPTAVITGDKSRTHL